jgi:hypothetical protein
VIGRKLKLQTVSVSPGDAATISAFLPCFSAWTPQRQARLRAISWAGHLPTAG